MSKRKVNTFRRLVATVVLSAGLLAGLVIVPSCTPEQLAKIDQGVKDANTASEGAAAIATGPAGALIPPQIRLILQLLGFVGPLAVAIWEKIRASRVLEKNADLGTTLAAVVDAIDQADAESAEKVKANVMAIATRRRIFDTADALIDEHRTVKRSPAA